MLSPRQHPRQLQARCFSTFLYFPIAGSVEWYCQQIMDLCTSARNHAAIHPTTQNYPEILPAMRCDANVAAGEHV